MSRTINVLQNKFGHPPVNELKANDNAALIPDDFLSIWSNVLDFGYHCQERTISNISCKSKEKSKVRQPPPAIINIDLEPKPAKRKSRWSFFEEKVENYKQYDGLGEEDHEKLQVLDCGLHYDEATGEYLALQEGPWPWGGGKTHWTCPTWL